MRPANLRTFDEAFSQLTDAIDCTWCIAKAGQPCIDDNGGPMRGKVHASRIGGIMSECPHGKPLNQHCQQCVPSPNAVEECASATPKPRAGEHTSEPWRATFGDSEAFLKACVNVDVGHIYNAADARRIVACVNACDGINTPTLEAEGSKFALQRWAEVSKDREELIEALNVIAGEPRQDDTYVGMDSKQIARAVLSKVITK